MKKKKDIASENKSYSRFLEETEQWSIHYNPETEVEMTSFTHTLLVPFVYKMAFVQGLFDSLSCILLVHRLYSDEKHWSVVITG